MAVMPQVSLPVRPYPTPVNPFSDTLSALSMLAKFKQMKAKEPLIKAQTGLTKAQAANLQAKTPYEGLTAKAGAESKMARAQQIMAQLNDPSLASTGGGAAGAYGKYLQAKNKWGTNDNRTNQYWNVYQSELVKAVSRMPTAWKNIALVKAGRVPNLLQSAPTSSGNGLPPSNALQPQQHQNVSNAVQSLMGNLSGGINPQNLQGIASSPNAFVGQQQNLTGGVPPTGQPQLTTPQIPQTAPPTAVQPGAQPPSGDSSAYTELTDAEKDTLRSYNEKLSTTAAIANARVRGVVAVTGLNDAKANLSAVKGFMGVGGSIKMMKDKILGMSGVTTKDPNYIKARFFVEKQLPLIAKDVTNLMMDPHTDQSTKDALRLSGASDFYNMTYSQFVETVNLYGEYLNTLNRGLNVSLGVIGRGEAEKFIPYVPIAGGTSAPTPGAAAAPTSRAVKSSKEKWDF